jgi:cytochrome c peroxidase
MLGACSAESVDTDHDLLAPRATAAAPHQQSATVNPRLLRRFKAVRRRLDAEESTAAQVKLGRTLFFDKRLSKDGTISCNSCHPLDRYGADGEKTSKGLGGQTGRRNSPSVFHAAGHFTAFWDGRAASVEEQAKGPILNPVEMGMNSPAAVVTTLEAVPGYAPMFAAAFPGSGDAITYDNVGRAIGAFERGLVTPSRWDRYLEGDQAALTTREVAGLRLFTDLGCMTCHTGEFLGGTSFQKAGVVAPWPNQDDTGRAEVTKVAADKMMFKVPSLRNIAKTAPYFHDGSVATLEQAVDQMARVQLGEELPKADLEAIVAWLGSLTGELDPEYIREPALP